MSPCSNFLADSPWDLAVVDRAVAERVCAVIEPGAWVLDDTGVVKDGKHSPGVKRRYSGTLGKTGNCQVTVSLHAVGATDTVPLGFRLYLPEEWCDDLPRRRKAKVPEDVEFQTKPAIGGELVAGAAGWRIRRAPVLGDQACGDDAKLRTRLHGDGIDYVLSIGGACGVYEPGTVFAVAEREPGSRGRPPSVLRAEREPSSIAELVVGLDEHVWLTVCFRDRDSVQLHSRFAFVRVIAANPVDQLRQPPREEWLLAESPEGKDAPTDYRDQQPARRHRARAPRPTGAITVDDRAGLQAAQEQAWPRPLRGPQLPRLPPPLHDRRCRPRLPDARERRPKSPAAGLTLPQTVRLLQPFFLVLDRPLPHLPATDRPDRATAPPRTTARVTQPTKSTNSWSRVVTSTRFRPASQRIPGQLAADCAVKQPHAAERRNLASQVPDCAPVQVARAVCLAARVPGQQST